MLHRQLLYHCHHDHWNTTDGCWTLFRSRRVVAVCKMATQNKKFSNTLRVEHACLGRDSPTCLRAPVTTILQPSLLSNASVRLFCKHADIQTSLMQAQLERLPHSVRRAVSVRRAHRKY